MNDEKPRFENKIAIVLAERLLLWQELNVTAFLASTIASHFPETVGKEFVDASGANYLGMFRRPVMIFQRTRFRWFSYLWTEESR